ncbi:MAG: hypothetical protein GX455_04245 [Phycisphaerae bacterium]|nr:hypothetical protein [Phycisphaerae bacterium]
MDQLKSYWNRFGWIVSVMVITIGLPGCGVLENQRANSLFTENDAIGSLPADWEVAETNGTGTPAVWEIIPDKTAADGQKALAITRTQNAGRTFNMLVHRDISVGDVLFIVKVKAVSGKEDQGGGPVWRYQDNNNYYIARWNPLENNFRLYVVKDGKRKQLGSVDVQADSATWHTIRIDHSRDLIRATFDRDHLIEIRDDTLSAAGRIGLWTKADAATAFDSLQIFYPIK